MQSAVLSNTFTLPQTSSVAPSNLSVDNFAVLLNEYIQECELRLYSARTIESRRLFIGNLLWFLQHKDFRECGVSELRQFFHYLINGHTEPGGRFGHKHLNRPVRPVTVKDYYNCIRPFFDWLVTRRVLAENPFEWIPTPHVRNEVKEPLSISQFQELIHSASKTLQPLRDVAILSLLLDTGCRASELISLKREDIDWDNRSCRVLGKGNKFRTIYFGEKTATALKAYVSSSGPAENSEPESLPLFLSTRGVEPDSMEGTRSLTRSGLLQLVERLSRAAGIKGSCSPHVLRRTFAVQTLRNGANVFSVQAMLGHTDLQMTRRYCAVANADVEAQHRAFAPMDRL